MCRSGGEAGTSTGSMPAKARMFGVVSVSPSASGSEGSATSRWKVSKSRPARVAVTRKRWLPPRRSGGVPARSTKNEKQSPASIAAAAISASSSSASLVCQSMSTSRVARARSGSRRSSAKPPLSRQRPVAASLRRGGGGAGGGAAGAPAERLGRPGISRRVLREQALDERPYAARPAGRRSAKAAGRRQAALERLADRELDLLRLRAGLQRVDEGAP